MSAMPFVNCPHGERQTLVVLESAHCGGCGQQFETVDNPTQAGITMPAIFYADCLRMRSLCGHCGGQIVMGTRPIKPDEVPA